MNLDGNQASIREAIDAGLLAGAVTLVWQAGEVLQVNELGYRDVDARLPMQRDTMFRIASMTKPVTVAAAMALVEEGKLSLTDPVAKWLPELADMRVLRRSAGTAGQDRAGPPADHDRRSDDAPQRAGVRVLGAAAAGLGIRQVVAAPGSGPLAGRVGQAAAGASARRSAHLQPRHRRARHRVVADRGQAAAPTCWRSGSSSRSACPTPGFRSARRAGGAPRRCTSSTTTTRCATT